jgi:hypothetical protein
MAGSVRDQMREPFGGHSVPVGDELLHGVGQARDLGLTGH